MSTFITHVNATVSTSNSDLGPFYKQYGPERILDALFLTIITVVGTLGNLLVILSIVFRKRICSNGNIFIVNLAIADLIVTGFFTPTVIANVVLTTNALSKLACDVSGYLVSVSSVCSVSNLACIAFNRYWAVVRHQSYACIFTKKILFVIAVLNWIWANLLIMPTVLGWTELTYEKEMMLCSYDEGKAPGYNIFLTILAISLPIIFTAVCYWRLFVGVAKRGSIAIRSSFRRSPHMKIMEQKRILRQYKLAKTLSVTVLICVLCWTPYGITILLDQKTVNPLIKKIASRLLIGNSAANFVIYGVMNPIFRRGYVDLLKYIFCCKRSKFRTETQKNENQQRSLIFFVSVLMKTVRYETEQMD